MTPANPWVFAENYLRASSREDRRFIMELLGPAIQEASGCPLHPLIDTEREPEAVAAFCRLAPGGWISHEPALPPAAADWLARRLPPDGYVVGYEMPHWLRRFLDERRRPWLDIRLSPHRFARDLMLAVRSSEPRTHQALLAAQLPAHLLRRSAVQAGASARRLRRLSPPVAPIPGEGSLVFIGQTASDAALISPEGRLLTVRDYEAPLRRLAEGGRRVFYHAHPYAGAHARQERALLAGLLKREVPPSGLTTSELLSLDTPVRLTGISSGLLQEATWFGVESEMLYRPVCPDTGEGAYARYYLNDLMTPAFWQAVRSEGEPVFSSGDGEPDLLRYLHNLWFSHDHYLEVRGPYQRHIRALGALLEREAARESEWREVRHSVILRWLLRGERVVRRLMHG